MFCSIWVHLGLFVCLTRCKMGAKVCTTKSRQNFLRQTQSILPHWTLNSCLCAFRIIWVHLGPFGWIAKSWCKTGLQVQKFELLSRVGILRNERTQSSELDFKLLFLCVLFYLGAFGTILLPYSVQNRQNWCKSSCHEVGSEFFRNKRNRSIADRKRSSRSG